VGVDYFTKWIEVKPLVVIIARIVQHFVWKNIICKFGIPHTIVTDNGWQFTDRTLVTFYKGLGIHHVTSSVKHPKTDSQAEANKIILNELKKRLGIAKRRWPKELFEVLWAYWCAPQSNTQDTPYNLVYGTDAMIPVEVGGPTLHRKLERMDLNNESLAVNLNIICELRDKVRIREEASKVRAARRYNTKVQSRSFCPEDLV